MSGGFFGDRGYDFEPVATLYYLTRAIEKNGLIPRKVEINPIMLGDPDGIITCNNNEIWWIQAKTRIPGGGNWRPGSADVVKAVSDFCAAYQEYQKGKILGAPTIIKFILCLEGEPNKELRQIKKSLETSDSPDSLKKINRWIEELLNSDTWKDRKDSNKKLLPRPSPEDVTVTLQTTKIDFRQPKDKIEELLQSKLGSYFDRFMILARSKVIEGSELEQLVEFISSNTNQIQKAKQRIENSNLPRSISQILISLLFRKHIIDFTSNPWEKDGLKLRIDGTIHTHQMTFGIHYSEDIIPGYDNTTPLLDTIIPGVQELILVTTSRISRQYRGLHLVNPDSQTLEEDIAKIVMSL